MTIALIAVLAMLVAILATSVAYNVMQGRWVQSAHAGELAAVGAATLANRTQLLAERERDQAVAAAAQVTRERDDAFAALETSQRAATAAREELTRRVQKLLDAGTTANSSDFLADLLSSPMPGVPDAAGPAADAAAERDGDRESPAVPLA
jgi:hypothetical protein